MALNIKNDRVHRMAREAARRSGVSQTSAIETALTLYLRVLDEQADEHSARVRGILADFDSLLSTEDRDAIRDPGLFDPVSGLPR